MKKVIFTGAALVMGAIAFTSCKKDFTCTCSYNLNGAAMSIEVPFNNMSKKDAKAGCNSYNSTVAGATGWSCELK